MPPLRSLSPRACVLLLAACALAMPSSGCVRRRMTIRTNPPGAQVFVDDQEVGTTPCSTGYVYYGTRKVTVIKDGYKTETLYHKFSPPWYQFPPLDFITENLLPREIRDERIVDVTLAPQEVVPEAALRAERKDSAAMPGADSTCPSSPPQRKSPPPRSPSSPRRRAIRGRGSISSSHP